MRLLSVVFHAVVLAVPLFPSVAESAELVMFDNPGCGWCARWKREVGAVYGKTDEGRILPLRAIVGRIPPPGDFSLERPIVVTPTFVVVEGGARADADRRLSGRIRFLAASRGRHPRVEAVMENSGRRSTRWGSGAAVERSSC